MGEWAYIDDKGYSFNYALCPSTNPNEIASLLTSTGEQKAVLILPSTERDKYCDMSAEATQQPVGTGVAVVAPERVAEVYYRYSILAVPADMPSADIPSDCRNIVKGGNLFPSNIINPDNDKWKTGTVRWTSITAAAEKAKPQLIKPILRDQFMVACIGQLDDDDIDDVVVQDHIRRTLIYSDDIKINTN
jgi:hypothetical protein